MKAQQLKNAILQLAIQGKLVPQDPNDEPASVLLEKIKQEKEKLIAEGKIKKSKKASDNPPYLNESEFPFEIPESWVWVRLGDITSKITDGSHNPPPNNLKGIPILSAANIFDHSIQFNTATRWISDIDWETENKRTDIQENDILLTIVGSIGRTAVVKNITKFALQRSVAVIKPIFIYSEYISYVLQTPLLLDVMNKNSKGTAQKGIYLSSVSGLQFPLPPLSEQKRIVAKIEELLPFIEQYAKKEQELTALHQAFPEQLKKSILQAAIQGKLTEQNPNDEPAIELVKRIQAEKERLILEKKIKKPKQHSEIIVRDNSHYEIVDGVERCIDDEIPFEIPESWCWVRLGDIFEITSSKRVHQSEWQSSGIPFYRAREIVSLKKKEKLRDPIFISKDIYDKNTTISGKPQIGDLLVTGVGTLGQAFLVENKSPFYFKDGNVVWFKNFSQIYTSYILYFMESSFFIEQIYSKSQGTTVGTFTIENAKNIFMPFPPLSEQQRIVSKIEKLFSSLENLTK